MPDTNFYVTSLEFLGVKLCSHVVVYPLALMQYDLLNAFALSNPGWCLGCAHGRGCRSVGATF